MSRKKTTKKEEPVNDSQEDCQGGEMTPEPFSTLMKRLRAASGLSMREADHKSGVSKEQIYQIESGGTKDPRIQTVLNLLRAYGFSPKELENVTFPTED